MASPVEMSIFKGVTTPSKVVVMLTRIPGYSASSIILSLIHIFSEIHPVGMEEAQLLELAAYAEDYSNHPISLSIKNEIGRASCRERV